jgi:signal transduction histidine kinase
MIPLEESRFCRHLGAPQLELVRQRAIPKTYNLGDIIFLEGQEADGLYVINSGLIEIYASSTPERKHVLSRMEQGDYFGEMAIFDGGSRSASARALEKSELTFVPTEIVLALLEHSPLLSAVLVRDASLRMRDFNRRFLQESLNAERVQMVERLARTIVHDFRNPLNVIGLAADIAAEESASVESRRSARDQVRKQIEVLNRMMQELLDFTRSVPSSVILPKVRYADFITELLFEIRPEAARRGVQFSIEGHIPDVRVRLDPPRFTRVFTNLIQNAFDAMSGSSTGHLTLRFVREAEWIVTEIADNGRGISREHQAHVFEPFFTYGKAHGTGLGLAICERIIREHGGTIDVWSDPGKGATFRFRLPIPKAEDTDRIARVQA